MTSRLLSLGCALIAFSPTLTLLLLFTYNKAQLVIIVTTSAFFYLLSSLASSILSLPFTFLGGNGNGGEFEKWNAFVLIPISVVCQSFFRCAFVKVFRKVEGVIERSIVSHEQEEEEMDEIRRGRSRTRRGESHDASVDADDDGDEDNNGNRNNYGNGNGNDNDNERVSESSLLRLELNDIACSIAAGTGYSGMHSVLLYGTLLASEGGRLGALYQPSCAIMPSLINSAIMAFWFSILDIVWMMVAFYGIRMWDSHKLYQAQLQASREQGGQEQLQQQQQPQQQLFNAYSNGAAIMNEWSFGKGRVSGKAALLFMMVSHLLASLSTTMNVIIPANGCIVTLPLLTFVSIGIIWIVWVCLKDNFLPEGQKQRIRQATSNHLD